MSDQPWRPSRATTIVIGLLSVWPFVYMAFFFAMFASMWFRFSAASAKHPAEPPAFFLYVFPMHCGTMLLIFVLLAVYAVHAYRTDRIPADKRIVWMIILFFGNMLAFPIYWYLYMWREAPAASQPKTD